MLRIRFSMAVLGTILALGAAATDAEARHCRHQRHQQHGCGNQGGHMSYGQSGRCQSGCGYASNDNQNYSPQMNSNACCGVAQWQQNGSYQNPMSNSLTNAGYVTTPMASGSAATQGSGVATPPQPVENKLAKPSTAAVPASPPEPSPATVSSGETVAVNPPQPVISQAVVPAAEK